MLLRALLMLVSHAGAWCLAISLMSRLRTGSRSLDIVGILVLHSLVVTLGVLIVGSIGALNAVGLSVVGVAALAGAIALGGVKEWGAPLRDFIRGAWNEQRVVVALAAAIGIAVAVRHLLNLWWYGPHNADEVDYHLPRLAAWIQSGALVRPDMIDVRTFFPAGQQLLQAWWVGFLHNDALTEGASIEQAAMAAAAVLALSRNLGASRVESILAAALFATMPAVMLHATSAMSDMAACGFILAAFALVLRRSGFALAAAATLIGIGIKPSVGFALPGLMLLAWMNRRSAPSVAPRVLIAGVIAFAFLVGAYWYALNWRQFGSPIYPVSMSGEPVLPDTTVVTRPAFDRLWWSLMALFGQRIWNIVGSLDAPMGHQAGWGYILPVLGLPALAWTAWRSPAWRWPAAAFGLSFLTTLLMVEFDPFNARFVMWAPALMAGVIAARLCSAKPGIAFAVALLLVSTIHIASTATPRPFRAERGTLIRSVPWSERDAWQTFCTFTGTDDVELLKSDEPTMCVCYLGSVYALARGDFRRRLEHCSDPDAIVERARATGCRYIYVAFPPNLQDRYRHAEALQRATSNGRLKVIAPGWLELVR